MLNLDLACALEEVEDAFIGENAADRMVAR